MRGRDRQPAQPCAARPAAPRPSSWIQPVREGRRRCQRTITDVQAARVPSLTPYSPLLAALVVERVARVELAVVERRASADGEQLLPRLAALLAGVGEIAGEPSDAPDRSRGHGDARVRRGLPFCTFVFRRWLAVPFVRSGEMGRRQDAFDADEEVRRLAQRAVPVGVRQLEEVAHLPVQPEIAGARADAVMQAWAQERTAVLPLHQVRRRAPAATATAPDAVEEGGGRLLANAAGQHAEEGGVLLRCLLVLPAVDLIKQPGHLVPLVDVRIAPARHVEPVGRPAERRLGAEVALPGRAAVVRGRKGELLGAARVRQRVVDRQVGNRGVDRRQRLLLRIAGLSVRRSSVGIG